MRAYFVSKGKMIEKRKRKQKNADKRRRCTKKSLNKMYEESRKVVEDVAASKIYCAASFMIGDEEVIKPTAPI
eukprot:11596705-Ditylum_brightwellii.AAC.1